MSDERIRRPPLDRTRPIRAWSTLLEDRPSPSPSNGSDANGDKPTPDAPSPQDTIARSVDLGYKVIDEYIQRGQRAAERLRRGTYGADALGEDVQDLAGRLLRYASDLGATWLEVLERTGLGTARPATNGTLHSVANVEPRPIPARPLHVRVELSTARPAEVALDITDASSGEGLIVHGLRPPGGTGPRIQDVSFVPGANGNGTIRVVVPDTLPAGSYSGLVLDAATNRPIGAVTVVVHGP